MKIARSLQEVSRDKNSVVTVGTFDGVHRAHREIIMETVRRARATGGRSVVVTFDPHPKEVVVSPRGPVKLLSTMEERIEVIGALEADLLVIVQFTFSFSRISAEEFYGDYIVRGTGVAEVIVGYDHMFGRDREAGIEDLKRIGHESGFSVIAIPPFAIGGETVSSTKIRDALLAGNIARATEFLGRPYRFTGDVVRGDGRGSTLGFPTANIVLRSASKILPARGVYAVRARVGGEDLPGMMNIGTRPTVTDGAAVTIETHLFDVARPLYGEQMTVEVHRKLRDEQKFGSVEDLIAQLHQDREDARRALEQ
jgi:riboflavin kinase/FMN adenylyltransferase